jgi:hypothetical protein
MNSIERHAHWQTVYQTKGEHDVSWFEESPAISLELIRATGVSTTASIIDIGGGTSRLVDALLDEGYSAVTVLDLSEKALETSKTRLGPQSAAKAKWVAVDVTAWGTKPSVRCVARPRHVPFFDRSERACCLCRTSFASRALRWPRDYWDIRARRSGTVQRLAGCPLQRSGDQQNTRTFV